MTGSASTEPTASLRSILYDAAGHDEEVDLQSVKIDGLGQEQLLWVDIVGSGASLFSDDMRLAIAGGDEIRGLEIFDNFYRFSVPSPHGDGGHLRFAVGPSWVLTASERRPTFFDEFIEADQGETLKGRMSATAFMASLLMRYLSGFREEIAKVDGAIDKLDEIILRGREKRSPLRALAALRHKLADLRAILRPQRNVLHGLVAPDFLAHVAEADRDFLIEANRVFERLEDDLARARETVIGSFELYSSRVAQDTNQLVKVLTIATVITGVIGAVAGVFGMNFDTPITHSGSVGFLTVTGAMIASSVGLVMFARWRNWV